jgi:predicted phage tail protein
MTKIHIKGVLGKKFGSLFKISISNPISALRAIDANRNGFINELFNLSKKNINYHMICDSEFINYSDQLLERKNIKNIYILPAIVGSGEFIAAGVGLTAVNAAGVVTLTVAGKIVAFLANTLISTAISLGISFLMNSINKQATPPQQNISVGGATSIIEAKGRSYIFSNNINSAQQGSAIPVGFGKMKVSSQVASASIKSYPTNINVNNEFKILENSSAFLDFLTD